MPSLVMIVVQSNSGSPPSPGAYLMITMFSGGITQAWMTLGSPPCANAAGAPNRAAATATAQAVSARPGTRI
jgi:hypothetical protein